MLLNLKITVELTKKNDKLKIKASFERRGYPGSNDAFCCS